MPQAVAAEVAPKPVRRGRNAGARDVVVKSAGRVLRILEFFNSRRAPANAQAVALGLGYPQSSASALLRSLVASGYLHYDRRCRTYTPTVRVPLLGAGWVAPQLCGGSPFDQMMLRLRDATGGSVIFAARNGDVAEDLQVFAASGGPVLPGTSRRLTTPGIGQVLLATQSDAEVRSLLHRLNAEACARGEPVLRAQDALQELAQVRLRGYAAGPDALQPGIALVAIPLPLRELGGPFVLAIALDAEEAAARAPQLAQAMRREVEAHIGLLKPALRWPDAEKLATRRVTLRHDGGGSATARQVAHAPA